VRAKEHNMFRFILVIVAALLVSTPAFAVYPAEIEVCKTVAEYDGCFDSLVSSCGASDTCVAMVELGRIEAENLAIKAKSAELEAKNLKLETDLQEALVAPAVTSVAMPTTPAVADAPVGKCKAYIGRAPPDIANWESYSWRVEIAVTRDSGIYTLKWDHEFCELVYPSGAVEYETVVEGGESRVVSVLRGAGVIYVSPTHEGMTDYTVYKYESGPVVSGSRSWHSAGSYSRAKVVGKPGGRHIAAI
jgi:hypothetical protein